MRTDVLGGEDQLKHRYALGVLTTLFREANADGTNFSGQDLRGLDFTGASLRRATFDDAWIEGARFERAFVERWQLLRAADWDAHVRSWSAPATVGARAPDRMLEPFSEAPFAPELVGVPAWPLPCGLDDEEMDDAEAAALAEGRLAVASMPVTVGEFRFFRWRAGMSGVPDDWDTRAIPLGPSDADAYLRWLREATGVEYRIPGAALWRHLALAGRDLGDMFAAHKSDWAIGLRGRADRRNAFRMLDPIGAHPEFVHDGATGPFKSIGYAASAPPPFELREFLRPRPIRNARSDSTIALRLVRIFDLPGVVHG